MSVVLHPIREDGGSDALTSTHPDLVREVCEATAEMYGETGFTRPWTGYLAVSGGRVVGTCAFKTPPRDGKVEIACFTFPDHEGQGIGRAMAEALLAIAERSNPALLVTAMTLPEENPSTTILRKLGFDLVGPVEDPEDGTVWAWELSKD